MAVTNLDKFLEIEEMMKQAESQMDYYLEDLKVRYEYMNVLKHEYSVLLHSLGKIHQKLQQQITGFEDDDDVKVVKNSAIDKIEAHIESLEEENEYNDHDVAIKQLKDIRDSLETKLDEDSLGKAWRVLKVRQIDVEEINVLLDLADTYDSSDNADVREYLIKKINGIESEYLSSFVNFRKSCVNGDDFEQALQQLVNELEDAGFYKLAETLENAKPDTDNDRIERPDPEPLLNLLNPIRSAGLAYFQSRNRNSDSYDLNMAFAKEIAYARRALLEDREYIGTRNAFNRVNKAFEELSTYMYARYHQLGGTPNNYHGHEDRKK
ncbi:hypothetical protein ACY2DA_13495 [Staphylococcus simulans]